MTRLTAAQSRTDLFVPGQFRSHSGLLLPGKIECDALSDAEIGWFADAILRIHPGSFRTIIGIPRGGLRLASAIRDRSWKHRDFPSDCGVLIVDDVLTTGASMEAARESSGDLGAVMFAWGSCPDWITPVFAMNSRTIP